ncbi:hypothetical protein OSTOST_23999 [Ostertagia ostertagi]
MSLKLALNDPVSPLRVFYRQWEKAWRLKQQMLTASHNKEKEKTKESGSEKKPREKGKKVIKEAKTEAKPSKKKRKSTAAAERADETIPDQLLEDLGNWSDSN